MKLVIIFTLGFFFQASAAANAQKINLNLKNASLADLLKEIKKQSDYNFLYSPEVLAMAYPVSMNVKNAPLEEVLRKSFRGQPVIYTITNKTIVIKSKVQNDQADDAFPVSGRVLDDRGEPLAGVSVRLKGSNLATATDSKGNFSLTVDGSEQTLIFSYIGFANQEVALKGQSTIEVRLKPSQTSLNELVVVGYGERKKENYTGSISTVKTADITSAPVANISNALTGRLSGLISVQRNGEPGQDGAQLFIRGQSTLGNNSPLVVIDGIPRDDFSQMDPNEIESLTLLKDPASAAVFGVRAANGVILVTTKRGKAGKSVLSFSARSDWQKPAVLPKYLDSYGYASLYNKALEADGQPDKFTQADLDAYKNGSDPIGHPNTDWVKSLLAPYSPQQQYNVSLSGGSEKTRYFVSLGAIDQKGAYANSSFKRYNFRSNIDANVTSTTKISFDVSGRSEYRNAPSQAANQLLYYALFAPPIYTAVYPNGDYGAFPTGRNPAARAALGGYNNSVNNIFQSSVTLTQQLPFIKGLSAKGVIAYDRSYYTYKTWNTPYTVYNYDPPTKTYVPIQGDGIGSTSLYQGFNQNSSLTLEAHLNYQRTFGKHDIGALVLYSQNQDKFDEFSGSRDNFLSNNLDQLLAGNAATQLITGDAANSGRKSVVGRVNYAYAGKYLLEANFRDDGVSTFAPGRQFGFFPSVSAGWKISEENFIKDHIGGIDYFKLRGSYGVLGNDRIDPFRFLSTYGFGSGYVFGAGGDRKVYDGLYPSAAADPNTTWETAKSLNLGFDGSLFKRALSFEFDWFKKRTTGILIANTLGLPQTIGQDPPTENLGIVDNRGIEFTLTHENTVNFGSPFTYFIKANFTYAHNTIKYIGEQAGVNPNTQVTGRSIGQFFGYKATGLFQSQAEIDAAPKQQDPVKPGDIRYADLQGQDASGNYTGKPDGKVDGNDQTAIGHTALPQIIYGISGGFKYKGFDMSFLFQGAGQVSAFVTGELAWPFYNGAKALVDEQNSWTPANPNAAYPRLTANPSGNNLETSSYWLKNASYIRLKNLEFGYTVPLSITKRAGMSTARIFVSGQNLFTWDHLKVTDPEGPGDSGNNFNQNPSRGWYYPQQKVYAIGINVNF